MGEVMVQISLRRANLFSLTSSLLSITRTPSKKLLINLVSVDDTLSAS